MPNLTQALDGTMSFLGSSVNSARRHPRTSAAVALSAVAGVALAGLARHFRHRRVRT
jgi:hypothetical protein